mmetsp:Transcript_53253/g.142507  ORF Transcript_53253/g.142507 Transcript_53253/m.142507 type:complete len:202 (+) Transcript_53253:987-1592(+)
MRNGPRHEKNAELAGKMRVERVARIQALEKKTWCCQIRWEWAIPLGWIHWRPWTVGRSAPQTERKDTKIDPEGEAKLRLRRPVCRREDRPKEIWPLSWGWQSWLCNQSLISKKTCLCPPLDGNPNLRSRWQRHDDTPRCRRRHGTCPRPQIARPRFAMVAGLAGTMEGGSLSRGSCRRNQRLRGRRRERRLGRARRREGRR